LELANEVSGSGVGRHEPGGGSGTDFVLQLHYTSNGAAGADQTRIGLNIAKTPPAKRGFIAATYPDGRPEMLFDVPRYDFNWQQLYQVV